MTVTYKNFVSLQERIVEDRFVGENAKYNIAAPKIETFILKDDFDDKSSRKSKLAGKSTKKLFKRGSTTGILPVFGQRAMSQTVNTLKNKQEPPFGKTLSVENTSDKNYFATSKDL